MPRHSFTGYGIALVKSANQVALEAGNSPAIVFKHFRELVTEEQARERFDLLPKARALEQKSLIGPRQAA